QDDIRPLPGTRRDDVGEGPGDRVRNGDAVDAELLVGMVLPDVCLLQCTIRHTGNGQQDVYLVVVIALRQNLDVLSADLIRFAGGLVLDCRQGRVDLQ